MRQAADRLFIGGQGDNPPDDSFALVRAAKHPWHFEKVGNVPKEHPDYLSVREGNTLVLNLVDPPTPLFKLESFARFLAFAHEMYSAGKSILITCNQGKSRAPSLALLFAAKCLGAIASDSYDDAWDEFEKILGEPYTPGKGIEIFLRENWDRIPANHVAFIPGAAPAKEREPAPYEQQAGDQLSQVAALNAEECEALVRASPYLHFCGFARIKDKDGQLTGMNEHIEPNVFQARLFEAYEWCIANEVPIRIVAGPKPRQSGGSTGTAELCLHHSQKYKLAGMMLADENSRTDLIWDMFNEMVDNDRVGHIWGTRHTWNSEYATFFYKDKDGIERSFDWLRDTASDPKAGASGTRQVLWFSEAGRYSKEGKVTDQQVISNASSSVPYKPLTMIVQESTAEGASGSFFNTVKGAVTLEERMAGKVGNGYIKVSCWWHECPDYRLPRTSVNEPWFTAPLDDEEKRGVDLYGWTAEQIAWRRSKIEGDFKGNINLFRQEFPASEDEAFISSGNPRFSLDGIAHLEKQALVGHQYADIGVLEMPKPGIIQFLKSNEQPWLWLKEGPIYGCKYIVFADCMTGEQSAGSTERDEHAVGVWRAAYVDQNGTFHGTKLVAALTTPHGVRWDEDIIALRTYMLSRLYGNAIIAIEVNEALGVLRELVRLNANLWKRTKADEAAGIAGATLKIPGWKTTGGAGGSRSILVSAMAEFVREKQGEVCFLPLVQQLRVFVTYPNGTCAAKAGSKDDWVLGASIGLACLGAATEYRPPRPTTPQRVPDQGPTHSKGKGAFG